MNLPEGDRQRLAFGVGDHPHTIAFLEMVGGIHPVQRLVRAPVGVHGDTSVRFDHHQASCHGEVGRQPTRIVHRALRNHNPHGRSA